MSHQINELRQAVNRMMCEGTNGTLRLVPGRVAQLQDDCRERLIRSVIITEV